jgi:hypothetical protein
MAHQVRIKLNTTVVLHKDFAIEVKSTTSGKIGTLLVSKGNVEWLPRGNRVNRRRLSWWKLAGLMEAQGKRVKKR